MQSSRSEKRNKDGGSDGAVGANLKIMHFIKILSGRISETVINHCHQWTIRYRCTENTQSSGHLPRHPSQDPRGLS